MGILLIIFTILKYIVIALGLLLALALLLIAIFFFAPLTYKVFAETGTENAADVKLRWLFGIVKFNLVYKDDKTDTVFKIFWKRIGEKKERKIKTPKRKKLKSESDDRKYMEEKQIGVEEKFPEDKLFEKNFSEENPGELDEAEIPDKDGTEQRAAEKKQKKPKKSKSPKPSKDKESSIRDTLRYIKDIPDKKELMNLTLLLFRRVFKALKPSYFHLSGEIGFESPDLTGYFFAFLGMAQGFVKANINVKANFEEKANNLELKTKGWVTAFGLCLPVIRYILSRPVWRVIRRKKSMIVKKEPSA